MVNLKATVRVKTKKGDENCDNVTKKVRRRLFA